ncbi:glucosylglycerol-phosphate synthase [Zavarzinia compransoris]|uniref:glucosylglycerol-phosphate synthase n=1 Tax=Zavarzinia marina TaxID=2911065 RepID=UPI001F3FC903|nr:glucosylglycerol-phosphate synthase [Zavarzinia marina]MCF4164913.1 glucosylglycerol-phosphate synthase [Zavarzinia marina]
MKKSSLAIVYHRQPYEEVAVDGGVEFRPNRSPNGIVPTLKSLFNGIEAGRGAWIAWKIFEPSVGVDFDRVVHINDVNGGFTVSRLPLTADQVESFYHVTSKEALWPILHSFPQAFQYDNVDWETFREVNRLFAEATAEQLADDGVAWIHDYNLWLVPGFLRELKPDARIAFFHHTPFPAADVFNILPWRKEIMESLLACDQVGFHIPRYTKNFAEAAQALCGAMIDQTARVSEALSPIGQALSEPEVPTRLDHGGHQVHLSTAPVGTDPNGIQRVLETPESEDLQRRLVEEMGGRRLMVAVGRTDYTKGMIESLLAFERLLERRPELIGEIKLLVTSVRAASTMTVYETTQREIEALVGRINGRFSRFEWTPVVLFSQAIPFEQLLAHYRVADICLTTPLRDGLNLVAKEYIAANFGRTGVLVLSEFAGCAVELPDALLINPNSHRSMDKALDRALDMSVDEARERMVKMNKVIHDADVNHWREQILREFARLRRPMPRPLAASE